MDYSAFSARELKQFVEARTQKPFAVAAHKRNRRKFIKRLQRLDSATFRFLDLSGELRNGIYEAIFVEDGNRKPGEWQDRAAILRTSKQIYDEGMGILNDLNTARIHVYFDRQGPPYTDRAYVQSGLYGDVQPPLRALEPDYGGPEDADIRSLLLSCLHNLRKVEKLEIVFDPWDTWEQPTGDEKVWWTFPKTFLEKLVGSCKGLLSLKVTVCWSQIDGTTEEHLLEWLSALGGLSDKVTLDVQGLDDGTFQELWRRTG